MIVHGESGRQTVLPWWVSGVRRCSSLGFLGIFNSLVQQNEISVGKDIGGCLLNVGEMPRGRECCRVMSVV